MKKNQIYISQHHTIQELKKKIKSLEYENEMLRKRNFDLKQNLDDAKLEIQAGIDVVNGIKADFEKELENARKARRRYEELFSAAKSAKSDYESKVSELFGKTITGRKR